MLFNALFWCINSRSKDQKLPVMLLCLGEPPVRFLWCWLLFFIHCCSSFIDVYTFLSYFSMPPALHPGFSDPWRPLPALSSTLATFNWFYFLFHQPRALRFWVDIFYPHAFFTLHSFPNIFDTTWFFQGLPGSRQFFLDFCRASCWSSKHRPGPSVCLIHSNPQSSYSEEFNFSTKYYHELLVVKGLVFLLLTCFKLFLLVQSHMWRPYVICRKHFERDLYFL